MSFQKLFRKADEVSGLSAPFPLEQADTTAFDEETETSSGRSERITVAARELDKLHSAIKRVVICSQSSDSVVVGRITAGTHAKSVKIEPGATAGEMKERVLPELSWDAEIERTMEVGSSDDDSEHRRGDSRPPRENESVVPLAAGVHALRAAPAVLVQSFVNLNEEDEVGNGSADPLDVLILNPDRESYMKIMPDADAEGAHSDEGEAAAAAAPTSLFKSRSRAVVTASEADTSAPEPVVEMSLMTKAERDRQRKLDKAQRIKGVDINFDAVSSLERSANMRPRDVLPQYRNRASRSLIAALNHCTVATNHKNAKPDLYEVELKYFHRPRMIRERDRPWTIVPKSVYRKSSSAAKHGLVSSANPGGAGVGRLPSTADADKQNLSLASTHAEFILLEYVEEFPPVMLNYGMASAMFNYYRAGEQAEEEDGEKVRARSESKKIVESVLGDRHRSRLPRHLMLLLQLRNVKQTYDHDVSVPRLKQGETKVLNPEDESPFLGNIEEGEIQQSFTNNLFRAPIFKHAPHPTDFLLIRTKASPNMLTFVMREIPHLYLCGQLEPQKIVPRPVPMITQLQEKFYLLSAARFLQAHFDGANFDDLERHLLKYCLKESSAPHKAQHRHKLKAIVRKIADEARDGIAGVKWYPKDFAEHTANADEAAELERFYSPEEIARSFTPEEVCLQESCNAAEYRLFQQHIVDVDLGKVEMWLTHTHRVKQLQMDRAEKAKRLANDCKALNPALSHAIEKFLSVLIQQIRRTDAKLAVGRFIFDRLVSAPWNTTEAYVRSHLERDGQGKLELQGVGDPSGRGEGFSFVRIIKTARSGPAQKKKNTVKYFATDSDLRKLTKVDAVRLLVALGVRESEALALERWDRVHMIREFSTKLEKTGLAKELHKYARSGAEPNTTNTGESFQVIAQEIWNRQKAALSNTSRAITAASATTTTAATVTSVGQDTAGSTAAEESKGSHGDDRAQGTAESDSDSDEDFAESIARQLAARAAASATLDAKQSRSRAQIEEEEKKELNSLFSTMDKAKEAGSGSGSASAGNKAGDEAAVVKKRKVFVGGVSSGVSIGSSSADAGGADGDGPLSLVFSAPVAAAASAPAPAAFVDDWVRPKRVVRRLVRSVLADGTEVIRVEFSFSEAEVDRVERAAVRWRRERELRRHATAASGYASTHAAEEVDDNDDAIPTAVASMNINLSKMKKVVDQNNLVLKRERAEYDADEIYQQGGGLAKPIQKSSKRSAEIVINTRVPRVSLAARLEEELLKLWNNKHSYVFRYPVNPIEAPNYYQRIAEPICLSDIRDKIAFYHYETAAAMQEDVEKMARNAETYNGPAHSVTTSAKKLVKMLQINLRHEREHLGPEYDQVQFMEEAIKRKKVYLRKNHLSPAETNPLIPALK